MVKARSHFLTRSCGLEHVGVCEDIVRRAEKQEGLTLLSAPPWRSLCCSLPCSAMDCSPAWQRPVSDLLYKFHFLINVMN